MRPLTPTLLDAQRSASAAPYVRVTLYDRDAGARRLRWERWYEGSEPDGPCAAAVPGDGALLRARIDPATGALSHQRVASPGPSSDYTAWTALGSVAAAPRLGLAAAGSRVLLATVRAGGVTVEARESTDGGATFGASSAVATAGAAVQAVACALQPDGSAAVFYAEGGTVYAVTRSGLGAWSSPAAWTQSLDAVSGLAAHFEGDYQVLVSGTDAAGRAGCWATRLGAGGAAPVGQWASLTDLALASPGTGVAYLAAALAPAAGPCAVLVESYAGASGGAGAFDRVHLARALAGTDFGDFLWRDPRPFAHLSAHGLGLAAGASDAYLCSPHAVWRALLDETPVDLTADVLAVDARLAPDGGRVRLVLRNDPPPGGGLGSGPAGRYAEGAAPQALAPGGELAVEPGYVTAAGEEVVPGARYWIREVRRSRPATVGSERSTAGRSTVEVEAVDALGLLGAWRAPRQLAWAQGEASAFLVMRDIARRAGLLLSSGGASAEASALAPAYTVRPGEAGSTAVTRLLERLPDALRVFGEALTLREPLPADPTDYAYGEGGAASHPIRNATFNRCMSDAGWTRVFGEGGGGDALFAEAIDEAALVEGAPVLIAVDAGLDALARVQARAQTLLRRAALGAECAAVTVRPNAGQEVGDVVEVTEPALGVAAARFRVTSLRWRYERSPGARYEMTLGLGEV